MSPPGADAESVRPSAGALRSSWGPLHGEVPSTGVSIAKQAENIRRRLLRARLSSVAAPLATWIRTMPCAQLRPTDTSCVTCDTRSLKLLSATVSAPSALLRTIVAQRCLQERRDTSSQD